MCEKPWNKGSTARGHSRPWMVTQRIGARFGLISGLISQTYLQNCCDQWSATTNLIPIVSEWQLGKTKNPARGTMHSHFISFHPFPSGCFQVLVCVCRCVCVPNWRFRPKSQYISKSGNSGSLRNPQNHGLFEKGTPSPWVMIIPNIHGVDRGSTTLITNQMVLWNCSCWGYIYNEDIRYTPQHPQINAQGSVMIL